jgi:hypothetical protein
MAEYSEFEVLIMDKMESRITLDQSRRNIVIYSLYALYCRFYPYFAFLDQLIKDRI